MFRLKTGLILSDVPHLTVAFLYRIAYTVNDFSDRTFSSCLPWILPEGRRYWAPAGQASGQEISNEGTVRDVAVGIPKQATSNRE
jgi:hypothetical protein